MMAVHLNTSFLIRAGSVENATLRDWLSRRIDVGISVIASAEFFCGLLPDDGRAAARRLVESPVPFVEGHAEMAANLVDCSGRRRGSFVDRLLAAPALNERAQLATSNT